MNLFVSEKNLSRRRYLLRVESHNYLRRLCWSLRRMIQNGRGLTLHTIRDTWICIPMEHKLEKSELLRPKFRWMKLQTTLELQIFLPRLYLRYRYNWDFIIELRTPICSHQLRKLKRKFSKIKPTNSQHQISITTRRAVCTCVRESRIALPAKER